MTRYTDHLAVAYAELDRCINDLVGLVGVGDLGLPHLISAVFKCNDLIACARDPFFHFIGIKVLDLDLGTDYLVLTCDIGLGDLYLGLDLGSALFVDSLDAYNGVIPRNSFKVAALGACALFDLDMGSKRPLCLDDLVRIRVSDLVLNGIINDLEFQNRIVLFILGRVQLGIHSLLPKSVLSRSKRKGIRIGLLLSIARPAADKPAVCVTDLELRTVDHRTAVIILGNSELGGGARCSAVYIVELTCRIHYKAVTYEPACRCEGNIGLRSLVGHHEDTCGALDDDLFCRVEIPDNRPRNHVEPCVLIIGKRIAARKRLCTSVAECSLGNRITILIVDLDTVLGKNYLFGGIEIEHDRLALGHSDLNAVAVIACAAGNFDLRKIPVGIDIDRSIARERSRIYKQLLVIVSQLNINVLILFDQSFGYCIKIIENRLYDILGHLCRIHINVCDLFLGILEQTLGLIGIERSALLTNAACDVYRTVGV